MEEIIIFDTTLRDGDQAAGAAMTLSQKKEIAFALDDMGVQVIEAGFAASSPLDFQAIFEISKASKRATICSLSRASIRDIEKSAMALGPAIQQGRGRIHVFISTSDAHMKTKLNKTRAEVLNMIEQSVSYAKTFTPDVEWSAEDASRSDVDFLSQCVRAAVNAGATTINLPDTVGHMASTQYYHFIKAVKEKAQVSDKIIFSVHCHNDKGLATANSLFGIEAGARQVECSINGLGERAGNAAMEEVIANIRAMPEVYPFNIPLDTRQMKSISKMVECYSGFNISAQKPIVGDNVFNHGSGIHQDGYIKSLTSGQKCMYGGVNPEDFGIQERITLTRHSGKNGIRFIMEQQGLPTDETSVERTFNQVKKVGESQKVIPPEMLKELLEDHQNG